jgi:hypothetical protein
MLKRLAKGSILADNSGQDNLEYVIMGLVAVLIAGIIYAVFSDGPFRDKVNLIFSSWVK